MSLTSSYDKFFLEKLKVSTTVILNGYLNKSTLSKQLNKAQTDDFNKSYLTIHLRSISEKDVGNLYFVRGFLDAILLSSMP